MYCLPDAKQTLVRPIYSTCRMLCYFTQHLGKLQIAFQIYTANSVETSLFDSLSVALFREFLFSLRKTFNYLLRTFSSTCSKL